MRNTEPDPENDRYAYSRAALARIVLSFEQQQLAVQAAAGVPTDDAYATPGSLVTEAQQLVDLARDVLTRSVIYERTKGTSWEEIGEALGITRQSAHERFKAAMDEWELSLVQPFQKDESWPIASMRIHEAAYEPTRTGRQLDQWVRETLPAYRDQEHPVSGHLRPLSAVEEMNQVLAAISHLHSSGAGPAERAAVYERKAALLDRIAAEDGTPEAAEQAAETRARAAQLRAQAEGERA
ncbi:hypothetical protein ABT052_40470 [Streptomyces sp. NPDC002766]|uniref:hypothetical protein n=1 Tax=Streptomyces sp. NPDC002766 TaxID=3154429 RepID=UPI003316F06E